jgi:lipopolysaccharide/colanic/teichoic acid biosynthesis glycosyltransferase
MTTSLVENTEAAGLVYADAAPLYSTRQVGLGAAAKRLLDVTGALVALVALAPVMIAAAVAIVVESGWPPIFAQKRVGHGGRLFTVYKFRSMVRDADGLKEKLKKYNEVTDGPTFKLKKDPRVTKVGAFLRRTSLDELPQLINVLQGNMSLVGPRPALESEVMEYEPWQLARFAVKPGLTGLWQVSGRSNLGFVEMVSLDIEYSETWSLWQDIVLLARTPAAVISARGAY